jgi:aminobenzoyl-glutamate transport protein
MTTTWLDRIERLGNRLPDPATQFAAGWVLILALSKLGSALGWSVADPRDAAKVVVVRDLLAGDDLTWVLTSPVRNMLDFPPLGLVLVALLGVGVAEQTGLLSAALRRFVRALPDRLLTPGVVLAGVLSTVSGDAGYVVLPPLAAALFARAGRAPVAGAIAVTYGIACGYAANLLPMPLDPLLSGMTEAAARSVDPARTIAPTCNWYFASASSMLLVAIGWTVTARVTEPALRAHSTPSAPDEAAVPGEGKALVAAGVTLALVVGAFAFALLSGPLAGTVEKAPGRIVPAWTEAIVPGILLGFGLPALVFGVISGRVRNDRDVTEAMTRTMASMGGYLVLAFFAGQMIAAFNRSNLSLLLAVSGADTIAATGAPIALLLLLVMVGTVGIDVLLVSASAKWAFMAPILIPMFLRLGVVPELVQGAYRVGDSIANPISPLNPYLLLVLAEVRRHDPDAGLGTLIARMLPYTLVTLALWPAMLLVWAGLGWPLGPG